MKTALKHLVDMITLPKDEYLEQEAEIFEIFAEEVEEILNELVNLVPEWIENSQDNEKLVTIRRYFHTLKGSGRMVGAKSSGELAWTVESLLNSVIANNIVLTTDIQYYVQVVVNLYRFKLFDEFKAVIAHQLDFRPLVLLGQRLQQQQSLEFELQELLGLAQSLTSSTSVTGLELTDDLNDSVQPQTDIVIASHHSVFTSDISSEMLEIFFEESNENLNIVNQFLDKTQPTTDDYNCLVRALHTLRGSSAMVGLEQLTKVSQYVEKSFEHKSSDSNVDTVAEAKVLLQDYRTFLIDYLQSLHQQDKSSLDHLYDNFNQVWSLEESSTDVEHISTQGIVTALLELDISLLLDAEFDFESNAQDSIYLQNLISQTENLIHYNHHKASVFIQDYSQKMKTAYANVLHNPELLKNSNVQQAFVDTHQQFVNLFDTLAAGQSIEIEQENAVTHLLTILVQDEETPISEIELTPNNTQSLDINDIDISAIVTRINSDKKQIESNLVNRDFDSDLLEIFLEEADELQIGIDKDLEQWSQDYRNVTALNSLMRYLHTLKGGANMVQANHLGLVAHELESIYEHIIAQVIPVSLNLERLIRIFQDEVSERLQILRDLQVDYPATETVNVLKNIMGYVADDKVSTTTHTIVNQANQIVQVDKVEPQTEIVVADHEQSVDDDIDSIIESEFLDEAAILLNTAHELLEQWKEERNNRNVLLRLQRTIHSLKGAARLAKRTVVSEVAAQLEHTFEQFAVHHFEATIYDKTLQEALRWFKPAIFSKDVSLAPAILDSLQNINYTQDKADDFINEIYIEDAVIGDGTEPPSMMGEWEQTEQSNNTEMIRISSDVIDKMLDLSGENSINRSRIEMDINSFTSTLSEMELTIKRLADQLRRMQGELETQILARHGGDEARYEDFDPLEMDQYSSLNQLSKSLAESASDLIDFKTTLTNKLSDTEGLLLQQFRLQNEMQESLMRTRLVPFSPMLPRLQRIVRQTSAKLDKPVEFITDSIDGEFDRNILEHLITPFEHMLRNALDHGLETREERGRTLKSEAGRIELKIERQGTDVVATLTDDGRGIDVRKIRRKAVERGLMQDNEQLEREEILQFIFHHGFSTAQEVSDISGRGVGLDVVQSEIRELGGHIGVDSVYGEGTTFTIRVPTTVAMSDALMIKHADQQYAIPLTQIDRMVRISPTILENYFKSKAEHLTIDNYNYRLRYLSELISDQPMPRFQDMNTPMPVLLLKSTSGQRVALLIDQSGSREQIVVKPIGEQFGSVGIIAGATILGDGRVCLILDTANMIRQVQTTNRLRQTDDVKEKDKVHQRNQRRLVMIVDDSVTVRKVTSRLLERNGYDVITAKDGVDAIEQLENVTPDLMLLDIEMPRMDGFEVTTLVRHHETHKDLPIIMITSRTGEKHRERALSLGVSAYMGKPFQEDALLSQIRSYLTVEMGNK